MQALWRTLRNPSEDIAHVAFRVLGKFGGSNRKMLKEAQRLAFDESSSMGPCLKVIFDGLKNPVHLPVTICLHFCVDSCLFSCILCIFQFILQFYVDSYLVLSIFVYIPIYQIKNLIFIILA